MGIIYLPYTLLFSLFFVVLAPAFWVYSRISGRYYENFSERLGWVPDQVLGRLSGHPRVWIHAVSLGEVKVAAAIITALKRLRPECSLLVSTTTESGRDMAQKEFGAEIPVVYAPVDFVGSVRNALLRIRPDVMVFLETELWPTWVRQARRMGIRTALINGRISARSIEGYLKMRFFFREVLKNYDVFSMIMEADAERIKSMGADSSKIEINGNAKYDLLAGSVDPDEEREIRGVLNLSAEERVFVAGSTRGGEEEMIFDAYERILEEFPDIVLVIAPRHIDRIPEIGAMLERRGIAYQLRTDLDNGGKRREKQIVLLDTFGELFHVYSVATIVFSGGSLVPLGGQNPLEPAVWGKAVFYGPHMDNFLDAKAVLESVGAGFSVEDSMSLAEKAIHFLSQPEKLRCFGERARQAVLRNKGAAEKHARVIERLLNA